MRSYSVAVASLALDAPPKWTDNAITQHPVEGVIAHHRGVPRRISFPALIRLAIARELHTCLDMSVATALRRAHLIDPNDSAAELTLGAVQLRIDLAAIRQRLESRLADALESAPQPRRGRVPLSRT